MLLQDKTAASCAPRRAITTGRLTPRRQRTVLPQEKPTLEQQIAQVAVRWQAARREAQRLKRQRNAVQCDRVAASAQFMKCFRMMNPHPDAGTWQPQRMHNEDGTTSWVTQTYVSQWLPVEQRCEPCQHAARLQEQAKDKERDAEQWLKSLQRLTLQAERQAR